MQNIRTLYAAVEQRMEQIDFGMLWQGFCRYEFALYTKDTVYLRNRELPWDERFLANTTIVFEGGQLAIWDIGAELSMGREPDVDILAAGMVHEMFHAFQMERGEVRFPDDIEGLDYPMEAANFRMKYLENKMLAQTFDVADQKEQQELLREFATLRMARQKCFGSKISYEDGVETVEGMAEYVGTRALSMLSSKKYRARVAAYQSRLRELSEDMFDVRNQSYYVGTLLLLAADEAEVSMAHEVGTERRSVCEILRERLDQEDDFISIVLGERREKQEKIIGDFKKKAVSEVTGTFEICGYDPMNMLKVGNQIYGSNFFALRAAGEKVTDCSDVEGQQDEVIRLFGATVLETDETGRVKKYYVK